MIVKIVLAVIIIALCYMVFAGKCNSGNTQNFMPYLPTERMCADTPEFWPEECKERPTLRENCCGAPAKAEIKLFLDSRTPRKEQCCGSSG